MSTWRVWRFANRCDVIPDDDLREHEPGEACWCNPTWDECVLVHHSMDGREAFERGERLHS